MGLSSLPSPSDGVLTLLVINTAISVAVVKEAARSVLSALRLRHSGPDPAIDSDPDPNRRIGDLLQPVRLDHAAGDGQVDCRVCLARFDPGSAMSRLSCGHVFHRLCVERWLDYRHVTCPLCRCRLIAAGDEEDGDESQSLCPWF